jgi:hypothetical protein
MYDFKMRQHIHGENVNSEGIETEYSEDISLNVRELNFV